MDSAEVVLIALVCAATDCRSLFLIGVNYIDRRIASRKNLAFEKLLPHRKSYFNGNTLEIEQHHPVFTFGVWPLLFCATARPRTNPIRSFSEPMLRHQ